MMTQSGISKLNDVVQGSLNVCLRALINKGSKENFANNQAHKIFLFTISVLGLILLSYYKAQMNAALNVEVDNMPIQSWQDLYESQYQILTVPGTFPYSKFKNAPEGSLMNKIYNEKVKTVPNEKQLGAITFEESVSVLLNEKYVAYYEMDSFTSYEEYPCEIVDLKYPEFRCVMLHITKTSVFSKLILLPIFQNFFLHYISFR